MMNLKTQENLLTLKQKLAINLPHPKSTSKMEMTPDRKARIQVLLMDLSEIGFKVDKKVLSILRQYNASELKEVSNFLTRELLVIKGGHVNYIPLFLNFPHDVPNDIDYLLRRFVGFFSNVFSDLNEQDENTTKLSCGHIVDAQLFDINAFGACPICQMQTTEQSNKAHLESNTNYQPLTEKVEYQLISHMSLEEQQNYILNLFYFSRPLSVKQREHLFAYMEHTPLQTLNKYFDHGQIKIKENLALYISRVFMFNNKTVKGFKDLHPNLSKSLNNVNDLLRVVSIFSGNDSALSNLKFKIRLSNKQRSFIVNCVEKTLNQYSVGGASSIVEKFEEGLKYRSLWVTLFKYLHISSYQDKYPLICKCASFVQEGYKTHKTLTQKVHKALVDKKSVDVISLLQAKNGMMLRNLDSIVRNLSPEQSMDFITNNLVKNKILSKAPTAMLTKLGAHFSNRTATSDLRYFLPKGDDSKIYVLNKDTRLAITDEVADYLFEVIVQEMANRFQKDPQFNTTDKIYIDDKLNSVLLPLNIQSSTKELSTLQKGSRVPLNLKKDVLRLFVYWKQKSPEQRVDVDLSMIGFDHVYKMASQVSFMRLSSNDGVVVHSGDIQSAPEGASEFIDIKYKELLKTGVRYVGILINSFTGQTFNTFECFAGLMERKDQKSGELFEPSTVTHKYDLSSASTSSIPFIIDLETGKLIWADIGGEKSTFSTVLTHKKKMSNLIRATKIMNLNNMSVGSLLKIHARSAGAELVTDPKLANVKIMIEDCLNPVNFVSKYIK